VGTITAVGATATFGRAGKQADEVTGISRLWWEFPYKADGAKLTWSGQLRLYKDGTPYTTENGKLKDGKLRDVPEFAKGNLGVEVQGAWEVTDGGTDPLVLHIDVKQVLCYAALVKRSAFGRSEVLKFEDTYGADSFKLKLLASDIKVSASRKLPFWDF
jgi:hypothetical protein